ncbi:MAG: ABC transporter ATP-binding protein [Methanomassiliicoccales archaeon]|uniref:ABC transporter ATP-binding protein n=1 Tax=Candidatus Methanarcanum hacksteinii TaxID=2911857 RepID=UPI002A78BFE4|nr:ABC transporter ATP-binding protein [Candidatus Methanomethylophilaceae archaeon]MCI6025100.1 ABC transporter ATP-binding protein [Methanomassiliicoccales archaeon]MDD7479276.1 ABC transporter ATP-binding protein [Methanomassiliicoccales archaeon]MDY4580553.1 ABC transporter ATP-binding protein [Candidatus Methanarcanum hacksteinii]
MRMSVRNLVQGYGSKTILDDISFDVDTGEVLALLGPNGSGKSTLIKTICNIMEPRSGQILIDETPIEDIDITDLAKIVSYVPQSTAAATYTTVMDTVLLGRKPYVTWSYRQKDIDYALDAMKAMRIIGYSSRDVSDLSGGQRQRVFLARSLAQCPSFFIFDEPTSALDLKHQMNTMIKMREVVHDKGAGMVIALHDINLAMNYSDKVLMLKNGKIFAYGTPDETITEENIRAVYGVESRIMEAEGRRFILPMSPDNFEDD